MEQNVRAGAGVRVQPDRVLLSKHFGIGGGLKYFNLNLQANLSRGGSAEYDFEFFGPANFGYTSF